LLSVLSIVDPCVIPCTYLRFVVIYCTYFRSVVCVVPIFDPLHPSYSLYQSRTYPLYYPPIAAPTFLYHPSVVYERTHRPSLLFIFLHPKHLVTPPPPPIYVQIPPFPQTGNPEDISKYIEMSNGTMTKGRVCYPLSTPVVWEAGRQGR
jgi:hypothetical protein